MRILVVEEDHGTRYFDASTDIKLSQACIKLLRERTEEGYYDPGVPPADMPVPVPDGLPDTIRPAYLAHNFALRQDSDRYAADVAWLAARDRVLASPVVVYQGRSVVALNLLNGHSWQRYAKSQLVELEMAAETIRPRGISEEQHFRMEQEGWSIFEDSGGAQVQRLDERDVLQDDAAAYVKAREMGLVIDDDGYLLTSADEVDTRATREAATNGD